MHSVFMDGMYKPLKQFIEEQTKSRKAAEEVVQKAFKSYTDRKNEDTKVIKERENIVIVLLKNVD